MVSGQLGIGKHRAIKQSQRGLRSVARIVHTQTNNPTAVAPTAAKMTERGTLARSSAQWTQVSVQAVTAMVNQCVRDEYGINWRPGLTEKGIDILKRWKYARVSSNSSHGMITALLASHATGVYRRVINKAVIR